MSKKQKRSLADPTTLNPQSDETFQVITELEAFFVNYHTLEGKKYKLLGCKDTKPR